jgi:DNA-binding SARP family transcriptional activator/DNA-binding XRE family transcriptional regulator
MNQATPSSLAARQHGGLGLLLRAHRRAAGLTQQRLAAAAEISVGALRDIEQGRTAGSRPSTLSRLAAVLELGEHDQFELQSLADLQRDSERLALQGMAAEDVPADGVWLVLLGPLRAWRDGVPVALGSVRQQVVLALLVLGGKSGVSRSELIDVLWPDGPPPTALEMLHSYISRTRRRLLQADNGDSPSASDDVLPWDGAAYRLAPGTIRSDAETSRALAARAGHAAGAGQAAEACQLYSQALRLWRGAPLAGLELIHDHPAVIELAEQRARMVLDYATAAEVAGEHEQVVGHLRAVAQQDPLDERVHARLMIALLALGQQAAGLRVYEDLRRRLDEELGVRPGPELAGAHMRVLRQELGPAARQPAAPPSMPGEAAQPSAGEDPQFSDLPVPRQLPPAGQYFVGRTAELGLLDDMLARAGQAPQTALIAAIGGSAGVGKTALAVTWAHRVAGQFPDGQLYVNLRGYGPSRRPAAASEVISSFLDALRVAPERKPAGLDGRVGLYRSLLAGKRVLIVLDNARSAEQVRPLLPGSPGCAVVVTSRSELLGLITDGARPLALSTLDRADAHALLAARLNGGRPPSSPEPADELISLCAELPLALSVAAARAARFPNAPIASVVAELRDERSRLDVLDTGEEATAVRAVFSWSYRVLGKPAARLFRLLGVHPGPDVTLAAAASVAAIPPDQAGRALEELTRAGLLTEHRPGRYAFHDLLRAYAAELAATADQSDRLAAIRRTADHYLQSAYLADRTLYAVRAPIDMPSPQSGCQPQTFAADSEALAWFDREHAVLLAVIDLAAANGLDSYAWRLAWAMETFFVRRTRWDDWAATQHTALEAARRLDDTDAQAHAHRGLGNAAITIGSYEQGQRHFSEAMRLREAGSDLAGQARLELDLARMAWLQRHYEEYLSHARRGLEIARAARHRPHEAHALASVAWALALLGSHEEALAYGEEALRMHHKIGDNHFEGQLWDTVAHAHFYLGQYADAIECYDQALTILEQCGYQQQKALTLTAAAQAHHAAGNQAAARQALGTALVILEDARHPGANVVAESIRGLNEHAPVDLVTMRLPKARDTNDHLALTCRPPAASDSGLSRLARCALATAAFCALALAAAAAMVLASGSPSRAADGGAAANVAAGPAAPPTSVPPDAHGRWINRAEL